MINLPVYFTHLIRSFSCLTLIVFLAGCGDDNDDSGTQEDARVGVVSAGAPVAGLDYSGPNYSGTTNQDGQFEYRLGDSVSFSLHGKPLGTVPGSNVITAEDIAGTKDEEAPHLNNMMYTIYNLDADRTPDNGFDLTQADKEGGTRLATVNWHEAHDSFIQHPALTDLMSEVVVDKSAADAQTAVQFMQEKVLQFRRYFHEAKLDNDTRHLLTYTGDRPTPGNSSIQSITFDASAAVFRDQSGQVLKQGSYHVTDKGRLVFPELNESWQIIRSGDQDGNQVYLKRNTSIVASTTNTDSQKNYLFSDAVAASVVQLNSQADPELGFLDHATPENPGPLKGDFLYDSEFELYFLESYNLLESANRNIEDGYHASTDAPFQTGFRRFEFKAENGNNLLINDKYNYFPGPGGFSGNGSVYNTSHGLGFDNQQFLFGFIDWKSSDVNASTVSQQTRVEEYRKGFSYYIFVAVTPGHGEKNYWVLLINKDSDALKYDETAKVSYYEAISHQCGDAYDKTQQTVSDYVLSCGQDCNATDDAAYVCTRFANCDNAGRGKDGCLRFPPNSISKVLTGFQAVDDMLLLNDDSID